MKPGDTVTWTHVPKGGYGFGIPVTVIVVKLGPKRILVQAPLASGGTKQVWVSPKSLRTS